MILIESIVQQMGFTNPALPNNRSNQLGVKIGASKIYKLVNTIHMTLDIWIVGPKKSL